MIEDKIFNNTYGTQDLTDTKIVFKVAPSYEDDMDFDDRMHYELLFENVDNLIK